MSAVSESALTTLIVAMLANIALAGLPGIRAALAAPESAMTALAGWFDTRLNRSHRGVSSRVIRGVAVSAVLLGLALAFAWAIGRANEAMPRGEIIEIIVLAMLIAPRPAFDRLRAVGRSLSDRGLVAGRAALAGLVGYATAGLDEHAVARGAIEAAMARLCDTVVAPVFWFLVLGLPGLCASRALSIVAERTARLDAPNAAFGFAADRLDRLASFVPAALSGLLIALAALFVPGAAPLRALAIVVRDWRLHPVPSRGWTSSASAGALGLVLAGPRRHREATVGGPWIGDGRARPAPPTSHARPICTASRCWSGSASWAPP